MILKQQFQDSQIWYLKIFCISLLLATLLPICDIIAQTAHSSLAKKSTSKSETADRPNILLFLADDMTWRDSEPYGNPDIKTPNISRLAEQGLKFQRMYTATAMCSPTRQQLYTGMFPIRNGAFPNHSKVYAGVKSLPYYLKDLGYRVGLTGKRHFGPAESFPFERVGDSDDVDTENLEAISSYMSRSQTEPFALVVAAHSPHKKWTKGDPDQYPPGELTVPPYLLDTPTTRRQLAAYYAEITHMDRQLGQVLDQLEKAGKAGNTLVIFSSEQGGQFPFAKWTCYENGLKTAFIARWPGQVAAGSENEVLVQYVDVVPTLVEIAGGDPRRINTGRPDTHGNTGFDGQSFLPLLKGKDQQVREYVYGVHTTLGIIGAEAPYPIRSVSDGRYKLIRNLNADAEFSNITNTPRDDELIKSWQQAAEDNINKQYRTHYYYKRPAVELYDLKQDPYELHNIAGNPAYNQIVNRLQEQLDEWMQQQGDQGLATELKAEKRQKN